MLARLPARGRSGIVLAAIVVTLVSAIALLVSPSCDLLPGSRQAVWCQSSSALVRSINDTLSNAGTQKHSPSGVEGETVGLRGLGSSPSVLPSNPADIKTPLFPSTSYRFLPVGCECSYPERPATTPPDGQRYPNSTELLKRFMAEDPVNVLAPTDQRRVLFVGDSFVRYLSVSTANRVVEEGWFRDQGNASSKAPSSVPLSDDEKPLLMDPWMLKYFGTHESPLPHINLSSAATEQKSKVVTTRYEAEPYLTPARDWTASGSIGFRPTHVVLQRGPWDLVMVSPHSPRRSFVQYVEGLVKARRTFPVNVRVAVYGLHAIHYENRTFDQPNDCGNRYETTIYRRMFFCAVRRANAILASEYAGSGLLEYYDSYAWSMGSTLSDTYHNDAIHYTGQAMAKLTDGMLDLFLRPPEYPAPLKADSCVMDLDFIRADETPCQPHFAKQRSTKVEHLAQECEAIKKFLVSSTYGLPERLMASEVALGTPSLGSPENVSYSAAVRAVEVGRCAGALLYVLRNIGRIADALAPYSPLDAATKEVLRLCQRRLDTSLVEGSPVFAAYNSMVYTGRFPCVDASFIPVMQSKLATPGAGKYEFPTKLVEYCYVESDFRDGVRYRLFDDAQQILASTRPTEPCLKFLDKIDAMPERSLPLPLDARNSLPYPTNTSLLTDAGFPLMPTYAVVKHLCISHFATYTKEELLKLAESKMCGAVGNIAKGLGALLYHNHGVHPVDFIKQSGCYQQ